MCPRPERLVAWQRLGTDLDISKLSLITNEIGLDEAIPTATKLLDGQVRGRVVVDVNG
jgi:acrylyl-CoA reductase (NADPH)